MRKVKITVLSTPLNKEIALTYGAPNLGPCPKHKVGEEFFCHGEKPEGVCGEAWVAIGKYAFALASGTNMFWPTWIDKNGISINSCNDGLRPVVFKLEVVSEDES